MRYGRVGRRDAVEEAIVLALEGCGCFVWRLHEPGDLLVWRLGEWRVVEVKNPGARPRRDQEKQRNLQRVLGIPKVSSVEEAVQLIGGRVGA
jgi:hypothetical protein